MARIMAMLGILYCIVQQPATKIDAQEPAVGQEEPLESPGRGEPLWQKGINDSMTKSRPLRSTEARLMMRSNEQLYVCGKEYCPHTSGKHLRNP